MSLSIENEQFLKKGDFLFKNEDDVDCCYILKKGKVILFREENLKICPIRVMTDGILGDDCVFNNSKSSFNYNALLLEDSLFLVLSKKEIDSYLSEKSEWIKEILNKLAFKVSLAVDNISQQRIMHESLLGEDELSDELIAFIRNSLNQES